MNLVVVGLGSNIDPNENIRTALRRIPELGEIPTWVSLPTKNHPGTQSRSKALLRARFSCEASDPVREPT